MTDPDPLAPFPEERREQLRETLAARVREAREDAGLTTRDVAEAMGKTLQWVRNIDHGRQWPPHWYLVALSDHVGRSVAWFYGEIGPRKQRGGKD